MVWLTLYRDISKDKHLEAKDQELKRCSAK